MAEPANRMSASDIRGAVGELTDAAKHQASVAADTAQHVATDTLSEVEAQIKKNPTQSALIAAGIGLIVGMLLAR